MTNPPPIQQGSLESDAAFELRRIAARKTPSATDPDACPSNYRDILYPSSRHDFTVVVQWDERRLDEQLMAKVASTVMCRWCRRIDKVLWQGSPS